MYTCSTMVRISLPILSSQTQLQKTTHLVPNSCCLSRPCGALLGWIWKGRRFGMYSKKSPGNTGLIVFMKKVKRKHVFYFQSLILGSFHIDTIGCCDLHVIQISILEVPCKLGGIILSNNSIYVNIVDPSFSRHAPSISQTLNLPSIISLSFHQNSFRFQTGIW